MKSLLRKTRHEATRKLFSINMTPYGTVRKDNWQALLAYEGYTKPNMSVAYKLTPAHLDPKRYQKMNVPLAFQLFSDRIRLAMEVYRKDPRCPRLRNCSPTIKFIAVIGNLIIAMMSRKADEALCPLETCKQKQAIEEFLNFLEEWQSLVKSEGFSFPISSSTLTGFKVTLGATLELLQFLHNEYHFEFLMTAGLNQDALERFFGMMRSACGSNDHPDPVLFTQVFRFL